MASTTPTPVAAPALPSIPLRDVAPWFALVAVLAFVILYFVGSEQGALSVFSGETVHEFVHDGRHLLGFPCH